MRFFDKAATALAATVLAATAFATPALAQKAANTVRFAYDQAPENVDPFFNNVRIGVIIGANVWDTLIYRDPNTNEYKGQLAKSWKQIDDKTIEFELREGDLPRFIVLDGLDLLGRPLRERLIDLAKARMQRLDGPTQLVLIP